MGQGLYLTYQRKQKMTQFKTLSQLLDYFKDEETCSVAADVSPAADPGTGP